MQFYQPKQLEKKVSHSSRIPQTVFLSKKKKKKINQKTK